MGKTIGFIGAGTMGGAIITGLLTGNAYRSDAITVTDTRLEALEELSKQYPGIQVSNANDPAAGCDLLVLSVKPQVYESVIRELGPSVAPETVVITIAPGLTIATVSGWFGGRGNIVRIMPNTPALVSEGMTAICPGPGVSNENIREVRTVFGAVGRTVMMPESLMDAYTSLAGSSPAWVFMFIEALADGGVREGIPRASAYQIAAQAVMGSAKLAVETGLHPGILKDRVCSPGGTTMAGVASLEESGFRSSVIEAVERCTRRAEEIGAQ